ncbi:hypothetical protein GO755_25025 [Spirosoma sp. HMF4905]|uniref:Uncharacterized protein n=1 Tax=Spirosoma arboris TaxID=2682092 RepID=A0A7K1SHN4_9BACT|nr:hypothetical protein [Spirosoma arboris]
MVISPTHQLKFINQPGRLYHFQPMNPFWRKQIQTLSMLKRSQKLSSRMLYNL